MPRRRKRVDPALFPLDPDLLRGGRHCDRSFLLAREALAGTGREPRVFWQVVCERAGVLSGVDEALAVLRAGVEEWGALTVHALFEGDRVEPWDAVLTVEGPYAAFVHLEAPILGTLARRTRVATGVRAVVEAARPKPVLFVGARFDLWAAQPGDGLAAQVGGASAVVTEAQASLSGLPLVVTVPHALVAAMRGDLAAAARAVAERAAPETRLMVLADYHNDAVRASVEAARALEGRLWGVRLDTPGYLVDRSVVPEMGRFAPTGVPPQLVWRVREALDGEGFGDVKIVIADGVTVERVRAYEDEGAPVDAYGVASAALAPRLRFGADVLRVDGEAEARAGRGERPSARLERVR